MSRRALCRRHVSSALASWGRSDRARAAFMAQPLNPLGRSTRLDNFNICFYSYYDGKGRGLWDIGKPNAGAYRKL